MDKMRNTQISPIPVIVVIVLVVMACGYFLWLRPAQMEDKIKKEWATPEAAALRGPGKPSTAKENPVIQQLLQKEGRERAARHRDRE